MIGIFENQPCCPVIVFYASSIKLDALDESKPQYHMNMIYCIALGRNHFRGICVKKNSLSLYLVHLVCPYRDDEHMLKK